MLALLPTILLSGVFLVLTALPGFGHLLILFSLAIIPYVLVNLYVFYRADGEVGLRPIKTFIWALSFTLVSAYHIYSYTNTRNIANDAAAKIADFRTKHGIYPVSLETIGVLNNAGFVRMRISYAYDPSAPRLFYLDTFLPFHVNFYDFDSGEWWTYAAD